MQTDSGDVVVAIMMAILGSIGLVMAARAQDDEIYVFGLSLLGFAVVFIVGMIKKHYDDADRRTASQPARRGDHV